MMVAGASWCDYYYTVKGSEDMSNPNRPLIIAHRGASAAKRENTIEAFLAAIEMGADGIEVDVRCTGDNVLVIHHDPSVAGSTTPISGLTYVEAEKIAGAAGFHLPTLEKTLDFCADRVLLDIELKEQGYEGDVVKLVKDRVGSTGAVFSSFNDSSVRQIKSMVPEFKVGLILGVAPPASFTTRLGELFPVKRLKRCGADFVAPHFRLLQFGFLSRMRSMGYPVWVWTVDDIGVAKRLTANGVAAIISNRPDILSGDS